MKSAPSAALLLSLSLASIPSTAFAHPRPPKRTGTRIGNSATNNYNLKNDKFGNNNQLNFQNTNDVSGGQSKVKQRRAAAAALYGDYSGLEELLLEARSAEADPIDSHIRFSSTRMPKDNVINVRSALADPDADPAAELDFLLSELELYSRSELDSQILHGRAPAPKGGAKRKGGPGAEGNRGVLNGGDARGGPSNTQGGANVNNSNNSKKNPRPANAGNTNHVSGGTTVGGAGGNNKGPAGNGGNLDIPITVPIPVRRRSVADGEDLELIYAREPRGKKGAVGKKGGVGAEGGRGMLNGGDARGGPSNTQGGANVNNSNNSKKNPGPANAGNTNNVNGGTTVGGTGGNNRGPAGNGGNLDIPISVAPVRRRSIWDVGGDELELIYVREPADKRGRPGKKDGPGSRGGRGMLNGGDARGGDSNTQGGNRVNNDNNFQKMNVGNGAQINAGNSNVVSGGGTQGGAGGANSGNGGKRGGVSLGAGLPKRDVVELVMEDILRRSAEAESEADAEADWLEGLYERDADAEAEPEAEADADADALADPEAEIYSRGEAWIEYVY